MSHLVDNLNAAIASLGGAINSAVTTLEAQAEIEHSIARLNQLTEKLKAVLPSVLPPIDAADAPAASETPEVTAAPDTADAEATPAPAEAEAASDTAEAAAAPDTAEATAEADAPADAAEAAATESTDATETPPVAEPAQD